MTDLVDDDLADAPVDRQVRALERILSGSPRVEAILAAAPALGLPDWYLGAGAVTGTVWNRAHGFAPDHGIKDNDLVYFDRDDLTRETEQEVERRAGRLLARTGVHLDVTNEARVHQWYEERFGPALDPYRSTGHAISTWPTTASSIGVRREAGTFSVCAPFGLRDLFALVVRPNRTLTTRAVYEAKSTRWQAAWPRLTVLPW